MKFVKMVGVTVLAICAMCLTACKFGSFNKGKDKDNSSTDEVVLSVQEALYANEEHIVIELTDRVTTVSCMGDAVGNPWGGQKTKSITINGNGNKLYFNDSYSCIIEATEGAKLIFNDVTIEGTTNKGGTWDLQNIMFANETEFNNVFFEQEIAFCATGKTMKLKDVTVYASKYDAYAVWVEAGTHVEMQDCEIVSTTGRAMKIADQYVDAPTVSNIVVKDTSFSSVKKAAIVVSSVAGANITIGKVDISKVMADKTNAVWTDVDYETNKDKVVVVGGSMVLKS